MDAVTLERFHAKTRADDTGACILWVGARTKQGYGNMRLGGRTGRNETAHRLAYEHWVGPVPDGLQLDHLCRHRSCVNPTHLEPVTRRVNILRGESPMARQARRTHCIHDHEFTPANTYIDPLGKRKCRACHAQQEAAKRARP